MKKYIIALGVLCLCLELVAQSYPKKKNAIRILTYNTHYCKGASDPGEIAKENIEHLAQIIKTLDADIVAFLYRDDYYRKESEESENAIEDNTIEVILEKNRAGARGTVKLLFQKEYNKFSSIAQFEES